MSIKVKAKAFKSMYHNTGFDIIAFSPVYPYPESLKLSKYLTFSCKGDLSWCSIGKEYELEIEEVETNKYGTTYSVVSVPSLMINLKDLTVAQSKELLMDFTTERQAENILSAYPDFIYKIVTEGKESIDIKKIHNVGEVYLNAYAREINTRYKYFGIIEKIKEWNIDVTDCKKLVDAFFDEINIVREFKENPYKCLIDILDRSFEKADSLIMELRPDLKYSEQRCAYLILNVLKKNEEEGSTRLNANIVYNYVINEYPQGKDIQELIVPTVKTNKLFYYNDETKDLAIMTTYLAECKIADFIKDKLKNSHKLNIDCEKYRVDGDVKLTDAQMGLLENFCNYDFTILAGYAGTGKSFSIHNLITLMDDNQLSYTLLSSTGKASRVLAENTHRTATTIHKRCFQGKISTDVVIVDECGMVNLDTFIMLLNAIDNENIKIILVGDNAQLSAIGLSKIFEDLIKSEKVPVTMLTEVFRYKSNGSLFVATNVRQGKSFFEDKENVKNNDGIYSIGNNYKFIEKQDDEIFDEVIKQYMSLLGKGINKKDILVLSPFNKGDMGTYKINNAIQAEINPPKVNEQYHTRKINNNTIIFRCGDLVINTKNDYHAVSEKAYHEMIDNGLQEEDVEDSVVVNGQIGIVREVVETGLIIQYDEELIYTSKAKLNNLLLGYAISSHKSQGSGSNYVISIVSNQHKRMLSRGLLYVMDTRCKKACIDIGQVEAFEAGLKVVDNDLKNTFLLELMLTN
jgi:RecD/TraA family predicted helicase